MVRVPPFGGGDGSGDALAALFFDPSAFPVTTTVPVWPGLLTGWKRSRKRSHTSVDPSAFGAVSPAVLAFYTVARQGGTCTPT
jgi:hypothetical protein